MGDILPDTLVYVKLLCVDIDKGIFFVLILTEYVKTQLSNFIFLGDCRISWIFILSLRSLFARYIIVRLQLLFHCVAFL